MKINNIRSYLLEVLLEPQERALKFLLVHVIFFLMIKKLFKTVVKLSNARLITSMAKEKTAF